MKVNHNRGRPRRRASASATSTEFEWQSKLTPERCRRWNGNRMKASAHDQTTTATTSNSRPPASTSARAASASAASAAAAAAAADESTTTTSTSMGARSHRSAGLGELIRRRPAVPQLLILTLILLAPLLVAGGSSTLLLADSNHHARGPLGSATAAAAARESRELELEAAAGNSTAGNADHDHERVRRADLSVAQVVARSGHHSDNVDDNNKLIGRGRQQLNVLADSLMDLDEDRPPREGYVPVEDNQFKRRQQPMTSPVRRLLVRQLTDLIMNHDAGQSIEARINRISSSAAQPASEMSSSADPLKSSAAATSMVAANNLPQRPPGAPTLEEGNFWQTAAANDESPPPVAYLLSGQQQQLDLSATVNPDELAADNYLATSSSGQDLDFQPGTSSEPSLVTCPPDYDDPAFEASGSNLDTEQQQQLLAGADSSGLLVGGGSNRTDAAAASASAHGRGANSQQGVGGGGQCVHPGMRMIEVITKIITPILFTIIIIVGLLGNIIVMMVILEDRQTERELTPTNLLILDLSLADLSFIIFCIPFTGWDYSVGHWVFGSLWCKFNQYLIVVCALSSIYTLVLMSVDRFMAIVYPIECISYRTSKNTLYAIYIKWIVILLMASPTIQMHGLIDLPMDPHQYACRFLSDQHDPLSFQITFFITSYLFPLVLIFCLYLSLLNKLWFGTKPHGHKESLKMLESKKKVTWLVAGIVVVFAICWCPIQVMLILMRLKSHKITATYVAIQVFSHTLGYMNSCVNPIVYAFASETFTNSFKRSRFFRICFCSSSSAADEHARAGYNYQSARPSNATFHNTTTLNAHHQHHHHQNTGNGGGGGGAIAGGNKALPVQYNSNNMVHGGAKLAVGRDDSFTCSTKISLAPTNNSNYDSNSSSKQVILPLEPRDRGVSPTFCQFNNNNNSDNTRNTTTTTTTNTNQRDEQLDAEKPRALDNKPVLIPREATISREDIILDARSKPGPPTKQQLVARVVQTGHNQASQRCETACYQRELMDP